MSFLNHTLQLMVSLPCIRTISVIALFICTTFNTTLQAKDPSFYLHHYGREEGFKKTYVYAICQDPKAFLWIGTAEGICRFDGFDFEFFTIEDGLAENIVTKLACDQNGNLFIGHQNGSVSLYSEEKFRVIKGGEDQRGAVSTFYFDRQGKLWIAFQNNSLGCINEDLSFTAIPVVHFDGQVSALAELDQDLFLFGADDALFIGQYLKDSAKIEAVESIEDYEGAKVVDIIRMSQDSYIVLSQETGIYLFEYDPKQKKYSLTVVDPNMEGLLDNLQQGLMDSKGSLWLVSMGNGILVYSTKNENLVLEKTISTADGLVSENPRTVFEDSEGSMWFGMYGDGLMRFMEKDFTIIDLTEGEEENEIYALAGAGDQFLGVTKDKVLVFDEHYKILHSFTLPLSYATDRVNSLYLDNEMTLWLGYEKSGVYTMNAYDGNFKQLPISKDALSNSINYISGSGENVWIASKRGICKINSQNKVLRWFTTDDGLPHNNIQHLLPGVEGKVFISTLCNEIFYIDANQEIGILENSQLEPLTSVTSVEYAKDSTIWISTLGSGVWKLKGSEKINFTKSSGLVSDYCYGISLGADQNPFVTHSGGVSKIFSGTSRTKSYGPSEGIGSDVQFYMNATQTDGAGNSLLGSSVGIIQFSGGNKKDSILPPELSIKAIYINGEKQDFQGNELILKPGQYDLRIDYIGIQHSNPAMVVYQTMLEGFDQDWSDYTRDRRLHIGRIDHGSYFFKVRAFGEGEYYSELAPGFALTIRRPLLLRPWFYFLIFTITIFAGYLAVLYRERQHRTEQKRLLAKIDETSREIIVKEEIIKERKKVEEALIEAKVRAELSDKLKTSFLQNISHEIRTPMNAIQGFIQLLKQDELSREKRDSYIRIIDSNATNLLQIITNIVELAELEADQLGIHMTRCRVDDLIREVGKKAQHAVLVAKKNKVEIKLVLPEEKETSIVSDPIRLRQVLEEIAGNAIKFTEIGSVTIGARVLSEKVEFFVEDTGIGLSEDKKEVIFDLFRKIDGDPMKLYGGTGLGLSLSRYLVHHLGGEIYVESALGKGSRFYFELPMEGQ